jgi:hypothetical protein
MARPGYRDDPEVEPDEPPFTEQDWVLWRWAHQWRLAVHRFENELDRLPQAARLRAEANHRSVDLTVVEPSHIPSTLVPGDGAGVKSQRVKKGK